MKIMSTEKGKLKVKVAKELPLVIARSAVERYFGGALNGRTLANLNWRGLGPKPKRMGRKVVYETTELLRWLREEKGLEIEVEIS